MDVAEPIDIFISYRRTDTKAVSRLIFEELCRRFGREHVFFDVDRIPLGAEHHRHLADQVASCSVLLVVIGDRWAEGPRAFSDDDLVRMEVRAALEAGIPIVPILADGADFPSASDALDLLQPLMRRPPFPVDSGRDFALHMVAVCRHLERLAGETRTETFRTRDGRTDIPTTMSNAPIATATVPPVGRRTAEPSRRWFIGLVLAGAAAAVVFSAFRLTGGNAVSSSPAAIAHVAPVVSAAIPNAAPANVSLQASASPAEATLYLDGQPLPSNPYVGRIAADGTPHLLRAEAPGYTSGNRVFVANREAAVIFTLARSSEPPRVVEGRKARPAIPSQPAASATTEPTTTSTADDCKLSPYYIDQRNIKVVKPECLRALQSP
jgi:hypothetical protein